MPLYANLRLRIESMFAPDLAHGITASEFDLAIITEPSDSPHLTRVQLATDPLCVIMPSDHPATAKQSASLSDFGGLGWMVFARKAHPVIYDRLMDEARLANYWPRSRDSPLRRSVQCRRFLSEQGCPGLAVVVRSCAKCPFADSGRRENGVICAPAA
jgi:DNA-binding transcriptional LysR family regulator